MESTKNLKNVESPDDYFEEYESLDVHELMLKDNPRVLAYKNAIFNKKDLFFNKIVMDVGAGTGILSIFCAQAGAKKVFAVEANKCSLLADEVVKENNFIDIIQVIPSKLEDVKPETIGKVDIIVSEWMGFYLVHEGMLDTVLIARDRFLNEDGQLFPNIAKMYAAPCQLPSMYDFWDNVHGVKMQCIGNKIRQQKKSKPEIMLVDDRDLLADPKILAWIDLKTAITVDLDIIGGQDLVFPCQQSGKLQGVCIWFEVEFPDGSLLSTSPSDYPTHWKQTSIPMPNSAEVVEGEPLAFRITLNRDMKDKRKYNLELIVLNPDETEHEIPCDCYMTKCIVTKQYMEIHN
ncbi:probable protein arginine N-methyltransferase 1.2 [Chelonus insularis]|uniref:probable protein arginine N-methyltransferase 1.2 n=1 Tax=Chelonus insularis TaxID=460826 RepID=UPI0015896ADE|nr:probable protein arginine N-methyltransferase 1.2 [Chelonus insularis]